MKLIKPTLLAFLVILTNLLISCGTPKELEYRDFENFTVEKMGLSSAAIKMDLVYYNPNNFGLQLKRTDLDIYIDSTYLGHTSQEYQITIPKKREFSLPVKVDVDMKNLFKNALNTAFKKEVMVRVVGTVKVGKMNVFKSFEVDYSGKHSVDLF
ncbi:LEA type 2 family protein [Ferruginibacter sp. SUN002]|uniref:LEA type 2 family protein n=1 Tax=Ferruginibacter sp. SUN002 TaxID=2937789 RepID=UPI003D36F0EA